MRALSASLTAARTSGVAAGLVFLVLSLPACRERDGVDSARDEAPEGVSSPASVTQFAATAPPAEATQPMAPSGRAVRLSDAGEPPVVTVSELEPVIPADICPAHMVHVRGGEFWMGSPRGRGATEERPRFLTRVADFCMDRHEVTTEDYTGCVGLGKCTVPHGTQSTCNYGKRDQHPINCVDWNQADAYCQGQGSRLPTELEWEYAARGGERYFPYSWGPESPDGRTCWKSNRSCPVESFEAGAFGLHDMSGNLWEWTHDWFGDYPWPKPTGRSKVFRGGSWSRRFDKWLRTTLRNRTGPDSWGSHLGFRCARPAKNAECPFGAATEPGFCRHGVIDAECSDPRHHWSGLRCTLPGSPECGASQDPLPGHGCVYREGAAPDRPAARSAESEEPPTRSRSPEFDEDCRLNQPSRPNAYLLRGGSHSGRNQQGKELGCKNRDVGVGWNSTCCP